MAEMKAEPKKEAKKQISSTPKKALPPIIKKGQYPFACLQFVYKLRVDEPGGDKELWIQGNYFKLEQNLF